MVDCSVYRREVAKYRYWHGQIPSSERAVTPLLSILAPMGLGIVSFSISGRPVNASVGEIRVKDPAANVSIQSCSFSLWVISV